MYLVGKKHNSLIFFKHIKTKEFFFEIHINLKFIENVNFDPFVYYVDHIAALKKKKIIIINLFNRKK